MSFISRDLFISKVYDKTAASDESGLTAGQKALIAAGALGSVGLMAAGGRSLLRSRNLRNVAKSYGDKVREINGAMPKMFVRNLDGHPDTLWIESNRVKPGQWLGTTHWWPVYADSKVPISNESLSNLRDYVKSLQGELAANSRLFDINTADANKLRLSAVKHLLGGLGVASATAAGTYAMD